METQTLLREKYPRDPLAWEKAYSAAKAMIWEALDEDVQDAFCHLQGDIVKLLADLDTTYVGNSIERQTALNVEPIQKPRSIYKSTEERNELATPQI